MDGMGRQDSPSCSDARGAVQERAAEIRRLTEEVQLVRYELDLRADRGAEDLENH